MRVHMLAGDLSDLHALTLCYAKTYCRSDEQRYIQWTTLTDEVEQTYRFDFPNAIPIEENRNVRSSGIHRIYKDSFNDEIIALHNTGKRLTEISHEKGCSKSCSSRLVRKRRFTDKKQ